MHWVVPSFLFGFLIALIIFGFNTPLLPKFQIIYSLPASWPEFSTAIGTISAALVALFLGLWGILKDVVNKPNMKRIDHYENPQANRQNITQGHTRLKFLNDGSKVAEDVIVYVDKLIEDGNPRPNFLPVPLSWTHDGRYIRNFAPHEVWFLDLCRKDNIENDQNPILVLGAGQGIPDYEDIHEGNTTLRIRLSHKSGQIRNFQIDLDWHFGNTFVQVLNFFEVL